MLKDKIKNGDMVLGTMISEFPDPNLLRIFKNAGYEYVIVDGEHGPFTSSQIATMISVGNAIGMPVLVRIPGIERGFITQTLDMGAEGFLVPMVNTQKDAEKLVQYSKYQPIGKRGVSCTRAHTNYNPPKLTDYMIQANNRIILFVQIETRQSIENVKDIASVPGLDGLIVGPSDLSTDLGMPGNLENPELIKSVQKVTKAADENGIHAGTVSGNMSYLGRCREAGMSIYCVGSELSMLVKASRKNVQDFENNIR